jgi:CBS-domain-containing membrane protein
MFIGLILIAVGVLALLIATGVLTGAAWSYIWPIILILLGLSFVFDRGRRRTYWHRRWGPPGDDEEKK